MDLTEFCKDMPEMQPVDPKDYIPIEMYPGHDFYVGKPNVDFRMKIRNLIILTRSDVREMKRLFEQWFQLYPDKKHLIDQIRKSTISLRGDGFHSTVSSKLGIGTKEQLDVLSVFVDEHTIQDNSTQPEGLHTSYNVEKLNLIFDRLKTKKIVKSGDRLKFTALFDMPIGEVYWNKDIRGAQAGLFDLMERITGDQVTSAMIKPHFHADVPIHDKWKDKTGKPSKLIDEIMKGI